MPADPFSCAGGHVGVLRRRMRSWCGDSGLGAASRRGIVWQRCLRRMARPQGRAADRQAACVGPGAVRSLGGGCAECTGPLWARVSEGGANGRRMRLLRLYLSRTAARCGSGSVRAAVLLRACLSFRDGCPPLAPVSRSCGPKRSAPETLMCGLRGADREARSVIFPPASGSGRASRRIRGSTPASSAA